MTEPGDVLQNNNDRQYKKFLKDGERAVSPAIGVILMVAITVILAAVIATFVLGLGDQVNSNANAGVTVDESTGTVTVTSLGSNTKEVVCVGSDGAVNNTLSNTGSSADCSGDTAVVAVGKGDTQNATIKTL